MYTLHVINHVVQANTIVYTLPSWYCLHTTIMVLFTHYHHGVLSMTTCMLMQDPWHQMKLINIPYRLCIHNLASYCWPICHLVTSGNLLVWYIVRIQLPNELPNQLHTLKDFSTNSMCNLSDLWPGCWQMGSCFCPMPGGQNHLQYLIK